MNNSNTNDQFSYTNGTYNYHDKTWIGDPPGWLDPYNYPTAPLPEDKIIKRVTKTIEKYGPGGNLISREIITEEEEMINKKSWGTQEFIITGDGNTANELNIDTLTDDNISSGNTTYKNDVPYTLTNGMSVNNIVANYDNSELLKE